MTKAYKTESSYRSAIKAISWRIVGTLDTIIISRFISGQNDVALKIGTAEIITKYVLYFVHERLWNFALGERPAKSFHLIIKSITWRVVGTADTIFLAWYFSGNFETGLQIGSLELLTKIILYYIHERIWIRVKLGTFRNFFKKIFGKRN